MRGLYKALFALAVITSIILGLLLGVRMMGDPPPNQTPAQAKVLAENSNITGWMWLAWLGSITAAGIYGSQSRPKELEGLRRY